MACGAKWTGAGFWKSWELALVHPNWGLAGPVQTSAVNFMIRVGGLLSFPMRATSIYNILTPAVAMK